MSGELPQQSRLEIYLQEQGIPFEPEVLVGISEVSSSILISIMQNPEFINDEVEEGRSYISDLLTNQRNKIEGIARAVRYSATEHIGTVLHALNILKENEGLGTSIDEDRLRAGINLHLFAARNGLEAALSDDPNQLADYLEFMLQLTGNELDSGTLNPLDEEHVKEERLVYEELLNRTITL